MRKEKSLIECAARALHRRRVEGQHPKPDNFPWEELSRREQALLRADVYAVLAAIREPSEAVLRVMRNTVPVDGLEWTYLDEDAADHWRAMIDAALQEGETPSPLS